MFPKLEKKFVFLYTLSTGIILTLILAVSFLFYISSQSSRQKSLFQDQLFTLMSQLETNSLFSDSYLSQMEHKNQLLIYIEENHSPFFFPGSYTPHTERDKLFERAENMAELEGIFPDSDPISSNLLQSSILQIAGDHGDSYLGNILILHTSAGYKKLILLQDVTGNRIQLLKTIVFYILIDFAGILLLFLAGRWFVRRSLKPLEETYEKQQDFVAAASHELRSPLTGIQAAADAALAAPLETKRLLSVIKKECQRGSSLIKNLLLLASADQNSWAVNKKHFELDEMLLNLMEVYEPLCLSKDGQILLVLPEEPIPPVMADPELCRQIFTILLDNAVVYGLDFSRNQMSETMDVSKEEQTHLQKNKKIILRAETLHSHVMVSVIDYGPGIPDEEKERIFDRFYRKDKARNKKEHFGLGLSIAAKLAQIQGLQLGVADTPGGGSTFWVRIGAY